MTTAGHFTPSGIAEAGYQRRRYGDKHGLPDPRRVWKPEADPAILGAITRCAFEAHVEQLLPLADRPAIALQLDVDLERRLPADDMIVLDRYGLSRSIANVGVQVGGVRPAWFGLPRPRRVRNMSGYFDHLFTAIEPGSLTTPLVPELLLGVFAPVIEAHDRRQAEFGVAGWPSTFQHEHKRRPIWAEIEAAFPRIGAWMAKQRGEA